MKFGWSNRKKRYNERTVAEQTNSGLNESLCGKNHGQNSTVFWHIRFGVIATEGKPLFNIIFLRQLPQNEALLHDGICKSQYSGSRHCYFSYLS